MLALIAAPVLADEQPAIGLPVALPSMPADIETIELADLPAIDLPSAYDYEIEGMLPELYAARARVSALYDEARASFNQELSRATSQINRTRVFTTNMRRIVGNPLAVDVQSDNAQYTSAYAIASEMSGAIQTSIIYLRGLSSLGATGLNLTFIFVGLAWVMVLRVLELLVSLAIAVRSFFLGVIKWIFESLRVVFDVLQLARVLAFFI